MAEDGAPVATGEQSTQTPMAPARRRLPRLARGTCIGRYVVIDVIGAGGMGVVYRAYDPELDRRIAIKLVRGDRRDPGQLVEEAQALARVSHPNVVHVYDVGTFGAQVFIAMELVEGKTLHTWRAQVKPSRRELLDVFLAAGRGLAAAHHAGIVHRDFKPSNVIVGDDGRVRVADFGLARAGDLTPPERGEARAITRASTPETTPHERPAAAPRRALPPGASLVTGGDTDGPSTSPTVEDRPPPREPALEELDDELEPLDTAPSLPRVIASRVMGTPSYMAPEQRRTGIYDARVDQYAFAVALYETLYGERPFEGTTDTQLAMNALADRVRPPPKGSDVPAHLRRALTRALRARPDDRFPSMDALLDAIAYDPVRVRRRAMAAAGAVALIAIAAWALLSRGGAADRCGDARALAGAWDDDVAVRIDHALRATGRPYAAAVSARVTAGLAGRADEWTRVRTSACLAHERGETSDELADRQTACLDRRAGELRALTATLARGPDPALLDHAIEAIAALPSSVACADRDALLAIPPPADPALRAKVAALREELAKVDAARWTGDYLKARDRAAALVHDAIALRYDPLTAEALFTAGSAARRADAFDAAENFFEDAIAHAAAAHDDRLAADGWVDLVGVVGFDLARPDEGKTLARAADAAVVRAGAEPELQARLLDAEALLTSGSATLDRGIALEREALAIRERGGDDIAIAESATDLGLLLSERGDYQAAEAQHRRALALRAKAVGDSNPLVADALDNLGVVLYHQGRLDEARADYEKALALRETAFGPVSRDVGTSLNNLGGLYLDLGDDARATDYLQRALDTWTRTLGADHPDLAIVLANLGDLANKRGDHAHALDLCTRALAIDQRSHGDDAPGAAYDLTCLAEAELAERPTDARDHLQHALAIREKDTGDEGELARSRFDLAQALAATGGNRLEARRLAGLACQTFDTLRGTWTARRDACTAWLATH